MVLAKRVSLDRAYTLINLQGVVPRVEKGEGTQKKAGFDVNSSPQKLFSLAYLLFLVPFALAYISWAYFPAVAQRVIRDVFGYVAREQAANPIWLGLIRFFYTWYTFLAIGFSGFWIATAILARRKRFSVKQEFYPMVSFVVPAFNEEAHVAGCVKSLAACAEAYGGNCEVIVVDDGSGDFTFEAARRAIAACKRSLPCRIHWRVVRHMTNLGKIEALQTGVNIALGQVVAVVDADS